MAINYIVGKSVFSQKSGQLSEVTFTLSTMANTVTIVGNYSLKGRNQYKNLGKLSNHY